MSLLVNVSKESNSPKHLRPSRSNTDFYEGLGCFCILNKKKRNSCKQDSWLSSDIKRKMSNLLNKIHLKLKNKRAFHKVLF